jgi:hypothetical protein
MRHLDETFVICASFLTSFDSNEITTSDAGFLTNVIYAGIMAPRVIGPLIRALQPKALSKIPTAPEVEALAQIERSDHGFDLRALFEVGETIGGPMSVGIAEPLDLSYFISNKPLQGTSANKKN